MNQGKNNCPRNTLKARNKINNRAEIWLFDCNFPTEAFVFVWVFRVFRVFRGQGSLSA